MQRDGTKTIKNSRKTVVKRRPPGSGGRRRSNANSINRNFFSVSGATQRTSADANASEAASADPDYFNTYPKSPSKGRRSGIALKGSPGRAAAAQRRRTVPAARTPKRIDVSRMQNYEIIDMLKERQLAASGFYEDNKKMLQKVLDEEYERDVKKMAEFNAEFWESRARETAMLQDIRRAQRNQMAEDQVVANAPKIRNWLKAVEAGTCGSHKSLNNCKKTLIRYVLRTLPRECSTLVSLDICWCEIDDSTAQMVGALIGSNNYLKVLDLSHNDIGSAGLQEIAKGVQRNDTLHSLTLDHNPVMKDEAGATSMLGIDALCEAVRLSPKLQRLNLLMTGVTKDAGAAIVTACQYSDTLLIVNVPLHAMTLQVQEQLAEKLSENRQLRDQAKRDERARRLEEAKEARDRELQAAKEREKNKAEQWVRDQAERRLMERRKQAWDELQRRTELQSAQIVEKHVAMLQALQGGTGKKKKKRRKKRKGKRKARKKKK